MPTKAWTLSIRVTEERERILEEALETTGRPQEERSELIFEALQEKMEREKNGEEE